MLCHPVSPDYPRLPERTVENGFSGTMTISHNHVMLPLGPQYSRQSSHERRLQINNLLDHINNELVARWDLGRRVIFGWQPSAAGIRVLFAPYRSLAQIRNAGLQESRLMRGRRLMGSGTFAEACRTLKERPAEIDLPFAVTEDDDGQGLPALAVERLLRRYAISETLYRGIGLFDIVGFSKRPPMLQPALLHALDEAINAAHSILRERGVLMSLARTTTGDGYYVWNREKGVESDAATYLLILLTLAYNEMARRRSGSELVPVLRSCFTIGSHFSYQGVELLRPRGYRYIVGQATIELARIIDKCLPGQILTGWFERPGDMDSDGFAPVHFAQGELFNPLRGVSLFDQSIADVRCYLTGPPVEHHSFAVSRFAIRDKHGGTHLVCNQKVTIDLEPAGVTARQEPSHLYLGRMHSDLRDFNATVERNVHFSI